MIYLVVVILFLIVCLIVGYIFDKKTPETDMLKIKINDYGKSIINLIMFASLALFCISFYLIINWVKQSDGLNEDIDMVQAKALVRVVQETDNEIENLNDDPIKLTEFEIFTNSSDLNIDFDYLNSVNSDTMGWLKVENTNINYPVVKYTDNDYYLKYTFTKKRNNNGWIFMDYRNSTETLDSNIIIYGHNLRNGGMFGTLRRVLNKEWIENEENLIIKYVTKDFYSEWQIFSVYISEPVTDYLKISFSGNEYSNFLDTISSKSIYNLNIDLDEDDRIMTFSSCNNSKRIVVHSKLIKTIYK